MSLVPHPLRPNAIALCGNCKVGRPVEELILNYGICDDCFETNCPCNDGKPGSCPLHRYPDVVLSFDRG